MRQVWIVLALLLLCGSVWAKADVDVDCNVDSDYNFALTERSVVFTREASAKVDTPKAIVVRQGRLFVDDAWRTVSAADHERLVTYEREARAIMPMALQIGRDAAGIAFTALGEVAAGFSSDPAETQHKLNQARRQLDARLARIVTANHYNNDELGKAIGSAVREAMPVVLSDIVGGAIRTAFSGDTARMQRLENLDKEIEARIAPRTKALERNAEKLCKQMEALDRIDNALEFRLPNGTPLNLLHVKRSPSQQHP